MAKRKYTWYIEPLSDQTNLKIGAHIIRKTTIRADCVAVRCVDGRERDLWRCGFDLVSFLRDSKEDLNLNFRVYIQVDNGPIRPCPSFLYKKKKKRKLKTK
ncbi:hypothetical protein AMJ47_01315 [Parcubacteria bacterium DG_72]|nr:MAG: hypothetical protein AMJ47_01315 [Parcubacteria bacterium DG_72]